MVLLGVRSFAWATFLMRTTIMLMVILMMLMMEMMTIWWWCWCWSRNVIVAIVLHTCRCRSFNWMCCVAFVEQKMLVEYRLECCTRRNRFIGIFFGARCNGKITSLCIFVSPLTLCPFCCIFYLTVISHTLIQTLTLIYICSPNFSVDSFVFFVQCVCVFFLSVCATTSFRYCYCTWFVLTHFQPIVQNLLLASLFNRSHTRKNHNIHIGIISFVMFSFPRFISCCCCCFCFWVGYCCCCFHFSSSSHSFKQ